MFEVTNLQKIFTLENFMTDCKSKIVILANFWVATVVLQLVHLSKLH